MPTKRELYEENETLRDIIEDVKTRLSDLDSDEEDLGEDEDTDSDSEDED